MSIQNLHRNDSRSIKCRLLNDKYYDFTLYRGGTIDVFDLDACKIADFSNVTTDKDGRIYSDSSWVGAVNEGVVLEDIGFTGIDNGLITFRKDRISNIDFMNILTGSTFEIESGDTRLFLSPISGNSMMYEYPMSVEEDEDGKYFSFKGGFYQGFFKLFGYKYQTLPTKIDNDLYLSFEIRPRTDYAISTDILNYTHKENNGIFFYIGTRAENKFWNYYNTDKAEMDKLKTKDASNEGYFAWENGEQYGIRENDVAKQEYLKDEEIKASEGKKECKCCKKEEKKCSCTNGNDLKKFVTVYDFYEVKQEETSRCCSCEEEKPVPPIDCEEYFQDGYLFRRERICPNTKKAVEEEYFGKDIIISEKEISDSAGHSIIESGQYDIETDNKFLMFDRTEDGMTVGKWKDGTKLTLTSRKKKTPNYFILMNRTETGYTVNTIDEYKDDEIVDYNIYRDIRDNAFALKINEDGSIGYKYSTTDCESEESKYSVIEEKSKPGMISNDSWNKVVVRFKVEGNANECKKGKQRPMRIYIYCNGNLVFISKELKELNLRELNDVYQKQEGVAYNMSLGGGTQGLLESVLPDYYNSPDYTLPLERDYCGTFIGDIRNFKMFNCFIDYKSLKKVFFDYPQKYH